MARTTKDWGLARGIERHNFLILYKTREYIEKLKFHGRVVDLGCGRASYKDTILQTASEYIGVDWENSMHDKSNVDVVADLNTKLPIPSESAEIIVSFNVLEHLSNPDGLIQESFRILKNDGVMHIIVPFMWHVHEEPYDYFRYTPHGLRFLLKKGGYRNIEIKPLVGFWQSWLLMFNYHTVRHEGTMFKFFWYLLWWIVQILAPLLDKLSTNKSNIYASHYTVVAQK